MGLILQELPSIQGMTDHNVGITWKRSQESLIGGMSAACVRCLVSHATCSWHRPAALLNVHSTLVLEGLDLIGLEIFGDCGSPVWLD